MILALGAFLGKCAGRNLGLDLPILSPWAQLLLGPLEAVENYFWPNRWTFYTPFSSAVSGGLPRWVTWLWLLSIAYLLGAITGKAAHRLFKPHRNQE